MNIRLHGDKTNSRAFGNTAISDITNDVRMDGVYFFRTSAAYPFEKIFEPGYFSYCIMVRRGRMRLTVEFPTPQSIDLEPGSIVGLSGLVPHVMHSLPRIAGLGPGVFEQMTISEPAAEDHDVELIVGVAPSESIALSNMIIGLIYLNSSSFPECSRRIWKAADLLEEEFSGEDQEYSQAIIVRRIAEIILINMTRSVIAKRRTEDDTIPRVRSSGVVAAIRAFLIAPLESWSVGKLARTAGMSRTKFAEEFRQTLGATPMQTLARIRLTVIARKLLTEELSVDEAADISGYSSSAAFIRAFNREFGMTPLQWRKLHSSGVNPRYLSR
jgi:AraC-like DNA-binding protein